MLHGLDTGPNSTHGVELPVKVADEAAQRLVLGSTVLANLGRAGASRDRVARTGGELDVPDARVAVVLTPVGLDTRDVLVVDQCECVRVTAVAAVIQISLCPVITSPITLMRSPVRMVIDLTLCPGEALPGLSYYFVKIQPLVHLIGVEALAEDNSATWSISAEFSRPW